MSDDLNKLLGDISKITGIKPKPAETPRPKMESVKGADVAKVVDEELSSLGWSPNARLSLLGDLGRENSWNRQTIFGGHADPKNKAFNRGIISWQGDRRKNLDNYLKNQGVLGRNDDDELRAMVRFMDNEMRSSREWQNIHKAMRNPNISTYDASENLRKYIKYVPDGEYNSYDSEFRVKNNKVYADKARKLGLAQNTQNAKEEDYTGLLGEIKQVTANAQNEPNKPLANDYAELLNEIKTVTGQGGTLKDLPNNQLSNQPLTPQPSPLGRNALPLPEIPLPNAPAELADIETVEKNKLRLDNNYQEYLKAAAKPDSAEARAEYEAIIKDSENRASEINKQAPIAQYPQGKPRVVPQNSLPPVPDTPITQGQLPPELSAGNQPLVRTSVNLRSKPQNMTAKDWLIENASRELAGRFGVNPGDAATILKAENVSDERVADATSSYLEENADEQGNISLEIAPNVLEKIKNQTTRRTDYETKKLAADEAIKKGKNAAQSYFETGLITKEQFDEIQAEEARARERFSGENSQRAFDSEYASRMGASQGFARPDTTDVRRGADEKINAEIAEKLSKYGSLGNYYKEQERIAKEYQFRPLAEPLEFAKNFGKSLPKAVSSVLKAADIVRETGSFLPSRAVDAVAGTNLSELTQADQGVAYQLGDSIDKFIEKNAPANPDFKDKFYLTVLPDTLGQLTVQLLTGALSGGATLPTILGTSMGAAGQYDEAKKKGATGNQKLLAALVGAMASAPDAVLFNKWFKLAPPAQKEGFLGKLANSIFARLAGEVGEREAANLTRQTMSSYVENLVKGGLLEGSQEIVENKINDALAYATYDPSAARYNKLTTINDEDVQSFLGGLIGGAVGGAVETKFKSLAFDAQNELANEAQNRLNEMLATNKITQAQKEQAEARLETLAQGAGDADKGAGKQKFDADIAPSISAAALPKPAFEIRRENRLTELGYAPQEIADMSGVEKQEIIDLNKPNEAKNQIVEKSSPVEAENVLPPAETQAQNDILNNKPQQPKPPDIAESVLANNGVLPVNRTEVSSSVEAEPIRQEKNEQAQQESVPSQIEQDSSENQTVTLPAPRRERLRLKPKFGILQGVSATADTERPSQANIQQNQQNQSEGKSSDQSSIDLSQENKSFASAVNRSEEVTKGLKKKEIWELTKKDLTEYGKRREIFREIKSGNRAYAVNIRFPRGEDIRVNYSDTINSPAKARAYLHKQYVKEAIATGRSVPAEVLADYPDLVSQLNKDNSVSPTENNTANQSKSNVSEKEPAVQENQLPEAKFYEYDAARNRAEEIDESEPENISEDDLSFDFSDDEDSTDTLENFLADETAPQPSPELTDSETKERIFDKPLSIETLFQNSFAAGYDGTMPNGEKYADKFLIKAYQYAKFANYVLRYGLADTSGNSRKSIALAEAGSLEHINALENEIERRGLVDEAENYYIDTRAVQKYYDEKQRSKTDKQARRTSLKKITPQDVARAEELRQTQDLGEILNDVTSRVSGDTLNLSPEAMEIILAARDLYSATDEPVTSAEFMTTQEVNDIVAKLSGFVKEAQSIGYTEQELAGVYQLIDNFEEASKTNGTVIPYVHSESLPHERFHQSSYLGAITKELENKIADLPQFAEQHRDLIDKARNTLFNRFEFYRNAPDSLIVEEMATYLATDDYATLGLSEDEGDAFLFDWFKAYQKKNGTDSLNNFEKIAAEFERIQRAIKETKNENNTRKENENQTERRDVQPGDKRESDGKSTKRSLQENEAGAETEGRKEKLSQTPKSLRKAGLPVADRTYLATTNAAQQKLADTQLDKGLEEAEKWFDEQIKDGNLNSGATTIVGINLMQAYAKTGDAKSLNRVADSLVPTVTEAAQAVQAMAILSAYSPTTAGAYAAKIKKQRTGEDLTDAELEKAGSIAREISEIAAAEGVSAKLLEEAQTKLAALEQEQKDAEKALKSATRRSEKLTIDLAEAKSDIRKLKVKIARLLKNRPARQRPVNISSLLRDLKPREAELLAAIEKAFAPEQTIPKSLATNTATSLKKLADNITQPLIDWATLNLLENIPQGLTVEEFFQNLNNLTNNRLTIEEQQTIHAEAVQRIRGSKPLTPEQKAAAKIRAEHYKEADTFINRFDEEARKIVKEWAKLPAPDRFETAILTEGVKFDAENNPVYTDAAMFHALVRRNSLSPAVAEEALLREFPELSKAEIKGAIIEANKLTENARKNIQARIIQAKNAFRLTEKEIESIRAEKRANTRDKMRATRRANQFYDSLAKTKWELRAQTINSLRRAGLLTGVRTHLQNIMSNAAFAVTEELARPLEAIADIAASRLTNERTVQGFSLRDSYKSLKSAFKTDETLKNLNRESGIETARNLMKYGDTDELARLQLTESDLGEKYGKAGAVVDAYINGVFRLLSAEDAMFKAVAFRRAISEESATIAQSEKLKDAAVDVEKRAAELERSPTALMAANAMYAAEYATFQNDNYISDKFRQFKNLDSRIKFVTELAVPFDRTPTNIVLRVLEYSPLGFAKATRNYIDLKDGNKTAQEKFSLKMRGAVEQDISAKFKNATAAQKREMIDQALEMAFSREQQRQFAKTVGRAGIGSAGFTLGFALAAAGILTGAMSPDDDRDEKGEFFERRKKGIENRSLYIKNVGRVVLPQDPFSKVLTAGATAFEQAVIGEKQRKNIVERTIEGAVETAKDAVFEQPLLNTAKDYFTGRKTYGERAGAFLGSFVPTLVADVGEIKDEAPRRAKGTIGSFTRRVPVAREYFAEESTSGVSKEERGSVLRRMVRAIDPFNTRSATEYDLSHGLISAPKDNLTRERRGLLERQKSGEDVKKELQAFGERLKEARNSGELDTKAVRDILRDSSRSDALVKIENTQNPRTVIEVYKNAGEKEKPFLKATIRRKFLKSKSLENKKIYKEFLNSQQ